jgi:cytochrome P450
VEPSCSSTTRSSGTLAVDPTLYESAIEEMLRFDPPFRWIGRVMKEDHAIGDITLRAGQWVFVGIAAANRDPRHFEEPNRFDITRHPNRHLTFGSGIHYCLGAPLARLEARTALPRLFERFPGSQTGPGVPECARRSASPPIGHCRSACRSAPRRAAAFDRLSPTAPRDPVQSRDARA